MSDDKYMPTEEQEQAAHREVASAWSQILDSELKSIAAESGGQPAREVLNRLVGIQNALLQHTALAINLREQLTDGIGATVGSHDDALDSYLDHLRRQVREWRPEVQP